MPCRKQHAEAGRLIGGVGGVVAYTAYFVERQKVDPYYQSNLIDFLLFTAGGTVLGEVAALLPDMLEPAHHSHHRNVCHSVSAASALMLGLNKTAASNLPRWGKALVNTAGLGYLSHLAMDAETARSLPLFGR